MSRWERWTERRLSDVLLVIGAVVTLVGFFLAISGVGTALGLPVILAGVVFLWVGWRGRPRGRAS